MIAARAKWPLTTRNSPPPFQMAMPPLARRGKERDRASTGGRLRSLARRKGRPRGSRKQSPVSSRTASGTPSTEASIWPETTA